MISKFFIDRPIFASVIAIIIVVLGLTAIKAMPVAQFPSITPPTVVVTANYPGADAKTMAETVLSPLESQISGADNLMYSSSSASANSGVATITCTFEVGTNLDMANVDIQNRVNLALPQLPSVVKNLGINVQKRTTDILMIVALYSPDGSQSDVQISNYALSNVLDEVKRIPGAGRAQIFGQRDYAMRVWLNPDKMAVMAISTTDVHNALNEQNLQIYPGRLGQAPAVSGQQLTYLLTSKGRLSEPKEFENIVVKAKNDGTIVRLRDIGRVELGAANYEFFGRVNGKPAALVAVFAQADANALDTAQAVYGTMERLSKNFPAGISYKVAHDSTKFVKISIEEVIKTLSEALLLVIFVIFLFLQSYRASLIALAAVPVSLMGAFVGMYLLGYSINTLTLFGMVLAIGIVVDDAIVVVENMERIMQTEKLSPKEAAIKAMRQVTSPIVAIVLVLCAVFIPATFMGGMTGQLYQQFAMTIAVSVLFSGFVALTLSPALGALLLKPHTRSPIKPIAAFNDWFARMTDRYVAASAWMIRRWAITLSLYSGVFVVIFFLSSSLPKSFLPSEDQGYFFSVVSLPDGASIERTTAVVEKVEKMAMSLEGQENVIAIVGNNFLAGQQEPNSATIVTRLKPWSERETKELSVKEQMQQLTKKVSAIGEASFMAFSPPPIRGLSTTGGVQLWLTQNGSDEKQLSAVTQQFLAKARELPEVATAMSPTRSNSPVIKVEVDRERAKTLGVSISELFATIQSTIGFSNVNQFEKDGRTYWVKVQSDAQFRSNPQDIGRAHVRSTTGAMIPLSALVKISFDTAPSKITHFNSSLGTQVMITPATGYSSGDTMVAIEKMAAQMLPPQVGYSWEGIAYQQKQTGERSKIIFIFGIVMVFLILAAQYEAWILPFAVIAAVPFGMLGAFAAVTLTGMTNDVYFQIGLLTLIGLAAKNSILVVEFAEHKRLEGATVMEATMAAARLRYRPMMMTSIAFVFGVLPLVLSSGAGAQSRHSIGMGILGGMLAATFIERYFIPYLYYGVATLREKIAKKKSRSQK